MVKDRLYRIEATLKEGVKADYLTLAIQLPSGEFLKSIPSGQLFSIL
jgi:phage protein D